MAEPEHTMQSSTGEQRGTTQRGDRPEEREEMGAAERSTRGTDRDLDRTGRSMNQGHGHPREERDRRSER